MTQTVDVQVAENGRILLPAFVREAMGVQGGAKLILTLEADEVRLTPLHHGISRARALYRQNVTSDRSIEAFIEERRLEAAREAGQTDSESEGDVS